MKLNLSVSILALSMLLTQNLFSQVIEQTEESYMKDIETYRTNKDQQMLNNETSPLTQSQMDNFNGLSYYPVNINYQIKGEFVANETPKEVNLMTSAGSKVSLIEYGVVTFKFEGKSLSLTVYQNNNLPEFGDNSQQLFIPFTDLTSGKETNAGGRYLAVDMPGNDNSMVLDFNKAMNPFSAYNDSNVSVIPPQANSLINTFAIGERKYEDRTN